MSGLGPRLHLGLASRSGAFGFELEALTMPADAQEVSLAQLGFNPEGGTIFLEFNPGARTVSDPSFIWLFALEGAGGSTVDAIELVENIAYSGGTGGYRSFVRNSGINEIVPADFAFASDTTHRYAISFKENEVIIAVDGTTIVNDTSVDLPEITSAWIGRRQAGSAWTGTISEFRYWPWTLTEAELIALTT